LLDNFFQGPGHVLRDDRSCKNHTMALGRVEQCVEN
jgi:hypothetical protein